MEASNEKGVLLLGLDQAGKTVLLYQLRFNEVIAAIPTISLNVETIERPGGLQLTFIDQGGEQKLRSSWQDYFGGASILVWCVGLDAPDRFAESAAELKQIIVHPKLASVPVLILCTKEDMVTKSKWDVLEVFGKVGVMDRIWGIKSCSAFTRSGLDDLLWWLANPAIATCIPED